MSGIFSKQFNVRQYIELDFGFNTVRPQRSQLFSCEIRDRINWHKIFQRRCRPIAKRQNGSTISRCRNQCDTISFAHLFRSRHVRYIMASDNLGQKCIIIWTFFVILKVFIDLKTVSKLIGSEGMVGRIFKISSGPKQCNNNDRKSWTAPRVLQ
jgi:hypothetical protein